MRQIRLPIGDFRLKLVNVVTQVADPVESVPPRGSGWADAAALKPTRRALINSIIRVWEIISLTLQDVIDCLGNALFVPESSLASSIGPGSEGIWPQTSFSELTSSVRLEGPKH